MVRRSGQYFDHTGVPEAHRFFLRQRLSALLKVAKHYAKSRNQAIQIQSTLPLRSEMRSNRGFK